MPFAEPQAVIREKNQMTIPRAVAERHGIAPGRRVVFIETGSQDEFTIRVLPNTYAGALAGVYGKATNENVEYVRREREDWG